ncbi:MAG: helix-turn-helix domain-containing protein [Balneolaceae bacterium]|nr:MAG: helix-turn-helix domain-containing protein [Balneolaceae bacterium]
MKEFSNPEIDARFTLAKGFPADYVNKGQFMMFIWNNGNHPVMAMIDDRKIELLPDHLLCTTYLHKVHIDNSGQNLKSLFFNREFYCVHTYDSEVSCNGLLFFGSNSSPVLKLDKDEINRLRTLFGVMEEEFSVVDSSQEEMLRILLKRLIIRCTRLAKKQILKRDDKQSDIDLIRTFNILVEEHFKAKKSVSEYAELMFKSPKTVTNVFSKYSEETPLQVIHNRVIMEAKRMLYYTDKTAKEIGYELGYSDPAQFSKLFKNHTGITTTKFKNRRHNLPIGQY